MIRKNWNPSPEFPRRARGHFLVRICNADNTESFGVLKKCLLVSGVGDPSGANKSYSGRFLIFSVLVGMNFPRGYPTGKSALSLGIPETSNFASFA